MLQPYWHSPRIEARVEYSRIRRWLILLLIPLNVICVGLLSASAQAWLAWPSAVFFIVQLAVLWRQPHLGLVLIWSQGQWEVRRDDSLVAVDKLRSGPCLPWLTCASWEEGGKRQQLVLFHDALEQQALRRLRLRLLLANKV